MIREFGQASLITRICSAGLYGGQNFGEEASTTFTGAAWPTANKALYVPVYIPEWVTIDRLYSINGATASGNLDLGIYDATGTKLMSTGLTAQAGASTIQIVSITATVLLPGRYYLAMSLSNNTGTVFRTQGAVDKAHGLKEQTSASPLPATATMAAVSQAFVPLIGAIPIGLF